MPSSTSLYSFKQPVIPTKQIAERKNSTQLLNSPSTNNLSNEHDYAGITNILYCVCCLCVYILKKKKD